MRFDIPGLTILSFFAASIFTACATIRDTLPPLEPRYYDFPVTGEVIAAGTIGSVIERANPNQPSPPPLEADILLAGNVGRPLFVMEWGRIRTVRLRYQDDDSRWLMPPVRRPYRWDGTVTIGDDSEDIRVGFNVYANRAGGRKRFVLTTASLGQASLEFGDPVEVFNTDRGNWPFLIGYAHLPTNSYRVFAVRNNSPQGSTGRVFFNPLQRFQFLDGENTVVAELEMGGYTIYDTLPYAELDGMRRALALLVAFRHSALVMRDFSGWDPPSRFYRFLYP